MCLLNISEETLHEANKRCDICEFCGIPTRLYMLCLWEWSKGLLEKCASSVFVTFSLWCPAYSLSLCLFTFCNSCHGSDTVLVWLVNIYNIRHRNESFPQLNIGRTDIQTVTGGKEANFHCWKLSRRLAVKIEAALNPNCQIYLHHRVRYAMWVHFE